MKLQYLYLVIDLLCFFIPLSASFYAKAPFYKKWKYLGISIVVPGIGFVVWDEIFTRLAVWGFNPNYICGVYIGSLPLEEILFFICIPYACVFTYFILNYLIEKDYLFPHQELISSALIIFLLISGIYNLDKIYTAITFIFLALFMAFLILKMRVRFMGRFYTAFGVILIPFLLINGLLTGSFLGEAVVWYNNQANLGFRLGTIPIEDVFYVMLLLLMNVTLYEWLQERNKI